MKQIKIVEKNRNAIVDAINAVEGKASVNLLSFQNLAELVEHAEKRLEELKIEKKNRAGAEFYYQPSGPWANSYSYGQGATSVQITRKTTGWFIKNVNRIKVYPKQKESMSLMLTEVQKNIAVTKFCGSFITMPTPVSDYAAQ